MCLDKEEGPGGATPPPRSGVAVERTNPTSKEKRLRWHRTAGQSLGTSVPVAQPCSCPTPVGTAESRDTHSSSLSCFQLEKGEKDPGHTGRPQTRKGNFLQTEIPHRENCQ